MAVKVVRPGVVRHTVCPHCGETLKYTAEDIQKTSGRPRGGVQNVHVWVECAKEDCGKMVTLRRWRVAV